MTRPVNVNRVLLVEDHATFRQALATIFESETDLEPEAQFGSLSEARRPAGPPASWTA